MSTLGYKHDIGYIPRFKDELAKVLAKRYYKQELEEPENQGLSEYKVCTKLYNHFMNMKKNQLYAIYFDKSKPKTNRTSRLEKDIERVESQQSLF